MKYFWLILLFVLVLLLCWPIRILFFAQDNNIRATLKLYFLNINLFDSSKKKEKKQNTQSSEKKDDQNAKPKQQAKSKSSVSLDTVLALVKSLFSGLGFLSCKLHFDKVNIDITAGKDEPDESAVFFGQVNSALYTALGVLGTYFKISYDQVIVRPDFEKRTFLYKISFSFWALPVTILATAIIVGVRFVILNPEFFIPNTRKGRKQ